MPDWRAAQRLGLRPGRAARRARGSTGPPPGWPTPCAPSGSRRRCCPVADGEGGTVTYDRSGTSVDVDAGTSLLDAGEAAGVLLPSGCRMGICFGCVLPLRSGAVRDVRTGDVHGEPGDLVQTCISAPAGDVVLDA